MAGVFNAEKALLNRSFYYLGLKPWCRQKAKLYIQPQILAHQQESFCQHRMVHAPSPAQEVVSLELMLRRLLPNVNIQSLAYEVVEVRVFDYENVHHFVLKSYALKWGNPRSMVSLFGKPRVHKVLYISLDALQSWLFILEHEK